MTDKKMHYYRVHPDLVAKLKEFRTKKNQEGFDKVLIDTEIATLGMEAFEKKYDKMPIKKSKK